MSGQEQRHKSVDVFPVDLTLELLNNKLDQLVSLRSGAGRQSTVSGWFFLTCGLGDALLSAYRMPTLSAWAFQSARDGIQAVPESGEALAWFDRLAPAIVVVVQFLFLLLAASGLRRSPWGAWMGRALRATSVWTCLATLLGPEFRGAVFKAKDIGKHGRNSIGPQVREIMDQLRSVLGSAVLLVVQLALWRTFWVSAIRLQASLSHTGQLPEWIPDVAFAAASFLAAWLLVTITINLLRDKSAILGITFGLGAVIVGFVYGQTAAQNLFTPGAIPLLESTRWWAIGVVFGCLLILGTLSLDTWNTGQVRNVRNGNSQWLYIPLPDLSGSVLPRLRFLIQSAEQSIVVFRRDQAGDYRFNDPQQPITPTDHAYEIVNLSNLGKQPELTVEVDSPDKSVKLKLQFLTRTIPPDTIYKAAELRAFSLAGPPVKRIIQAFFRRGEGHIAVLPPIMSEVVKIWLGKRSLTISELANRCDHVIRSATIGVALPISDVRAGDEGVAAALLAKISSSRGSVDLATNMTVAKLEKVQPAQLELLIIEQELMQYEEFLFGARAFIQDRFKEFVAEAIERGYPAEQQALYRPTLELLLRFINLELTAVSHEELPRLTDLRKKLQEAKQKLIEANKIDTSIDAAFRQRDATLVGLIGKAIEGQVDPEVLGRSIEAVIGGGGAITDRPQGRADNPVIDLKHEPPV